MDHFHHPAIVLIFCQECRDGCFRCTVPWKNTNSDLLLLVIEGIPQTWKKNTILNNKITKQMENRIHLKMWWFTCLSFGELLQATGDWKLPNSCVYLASFTLWSFYMPTWCPAYGVSLIGNAWAVPFSDRRFPSSKPIIRCFSQTPKQMYSCSML